MAQYEVPPELKEFVEEYARNMQTEKTALPTMLATLDFLRVIVSIEEKRGSLDVFIDNVRNRCHDNIEIARGLDPQERSEMYTSSILRLVRMMETLRSRADSDQSSA